MSSRPPKTHYASSSSTDTDSSSPSSSDTDLSIRISMDVQPVASVEVLRCLRCHRHVEATSTDDPASAGMIRVGFNLYYCQNLDDDNERCIALSRNSTLLFDLTQPSLGFLKRKQ
ncbi:hypothetical protein F4806DRAFT_496340 [Annulohypoxylon nitens]|nr:hypothetical protein F4806DRAFT_496340 [Annulohypoxylon nitens]